MGGDVAAVAACVGVGMGIDMLVATGVVTIVGVVDVGITAPKTAATNGVMAVEVAEGWAEVSNPLRVDDEIASGERADTDTGSEGEEDNAAAVVAAASGDGSVGIGGGGGAVEGGWAPTDLTAPTDGGEAAVALARAALLAGATEPRRAVGALSHKTPADGLTQ
jgi:hypothetical protein